MNDRYVEAAKVLLGRLPWPESYTGKNSLPSITLSIETISELEALRAALSSYVNSYRQKTLGKTFPIEYKGWRIEIKMGREFKGTRGSVKGKRGYIATRTSDGKIVEFAPSYDCTPSVSAVKTMIDAEVRAEELYRRES